jgi:hypothetical protein
MNKKLLPGEYKCITQEDDRDDRRDCFFSGQEEVIHAIASVDNSDTAKQCGILFCDQQNKVARCDTCGQHWTFF